MGPGGLQRNAPSEARAILYRHHRLRTPASPPLHRLLARTGSLRERAWETADAGDDDQFVSLGAEEGFGVIAAGTVCITFKVEIDRPWPTRRNPARDGRRRAEG